MISNMRPLQLVSLAQITKDNKKSFAYILNKIKFTYYQCKFYVINLIKLHKNRLNVNFIPLHAAV